MQRLWRRFTLVCSPGYFVLAYGFAQLSSLHLAVAFAVAAVFLTAAFALVWTRYTPAGRRETTASGSSDWNGTVIGVVFLTAVATAGYTALSVALYDVGVGTLSGGPLGGSALVDASYVSYLWHLADAVPLLKIPDTLHWKLVHPFTDTVQGLLALAYAITVIIPVIYIVTGLVTAALKDPTDAAEAADPKTEEPAHE